MLEALKRASVLEFFQLLPEVGADGKYVYSNSLVTTAACVAVDRKNRSALSAMMYLRPEAFAKIPSRYVKKVLLLTHFSILLTSLSRCSFNQDLLKRIAIDFASRSMADHFKLLLDIGVSVSGEAINVNAHSDSKQAKRTIDFALLGGAIFSNEQNTSMFYAVLAKNAQAVFLLDLVNAHFRSTNPELIELKDQLIASYESEFQAMSALIASGK